MKSKAEKQSQKKETTGAQNFRKVVKYFVFPMICASGRSESRLAEAAGAEPCRQRRNEYFHAAVARCAFSIQNAQHTTGSADFASCAVKKWYAAVKCTKHTIPRPLF